MRFVRGRDARYDLPRQVQMQLQMSGAGTRAESVGILSPALEGVWRRCLAVAEIEVRPASGGASDDVSACNSAACTEQVDRPLVEGVR